jgi:beta-aspartyl-peptidase (threonine type)
MRLFLLLPLLLTSFAVHAQPWAIAIHGGAGEAEWEHMDAATASAYHASLERALAAGSAVLARHGSALDAVEASVEVLEDDPLFNAGRGSAFTADGTNEMDSALMNGATLAAGSVASVHYTRHPVALARAVMEHTPYVMMVGPGADAFSRVQGQEQEPAAFFFTEMRWQEFAGVMRASGRPVPPRATCTCWRWPRTSRSTNLRTSLRHCGRCCTGCARPSRGCNLDRRHAGQVAGARG